MSMFKLPRGFCADIHSLINRYSWGGGRREVSSRKVHWIGKQKLCKSKSKVGLGYWDLEDFDVALLLNKFCGYSMQRILRFFGH